MSDNIKVVVKVRPLIPREVEEKLSYQWRVQSNTLYQVDESQKDTGTQYTFDKVYDQTTKTSDVYQDVAKPIVEAAIAGFNGTIFAYGQTSSGKTYTMSGTEESPGIIQLAVLNLFERIKCIPDRDFLVRVSYIEIYNETLKDLLNVNNEKIRVRDTLQGVKVEATEKFTSSPDEVMEIMREGVANRAIGATNMNEESSRSHSLFQITIESREHTDGETEEGGCVNVSTLNLVDLAGSERAGQTGATGLRFKEGTAINKSLSTLALVIKQLSEDPHKHANYRDSKLTRILQNSLGGNAKTSIICAVTPAALEETISTLQFATRAKAVKNKPEVNAVATDRTKLQDLTKQLAKLQSELALKKDIELDNRNLLKQISGLQKMILNGFGQQSRDTGSRRKTWCAPRRQTISSLPSAEEDKETAVQRFCTPSLKYNPQTVPHLREMRSVQRPTQLAAVSEETVMTTPKKDKNINFNDEIIDLDSDEETTSNTSRCSPYHKCYSQSKTPPCVLRKHAKNAEKNLKEIVELTNREKLFNPELVEYMEKLERSTNTIVRLEEEIKELSDKNLEKQCEVKVLQDKIERTQNEVKTITSTKAELEARYQESNTKITDLEVSCETLRLKAKRREEELLSLLNETEQRLASAMESKKTPKNLSRTFEKDLNNFMDLSKDISLVSDHDSTMETSNVGENAPSQEKVTEFISQIKYKDETILNLENDLKHQKLTIESLESMCKELREQITKTNNQLEDVDKENALLRSSVETLNSTIKSQKQSLEAANNDIQSFNSLIEELQSKLAAKTDNIDLNISDNVLQTMIANEDKVITNNENLKNIINSFKTALDKRNKEIDTLKSNLECKSPPRNGQLLSEDVEAKEQIDELVEQVQKSQKQIEENMDEINKLMQNNASLLKEKDELSEKLRDLEKFNNQIEKHNIELRNKNEDYVLQLNKLNETQDTFMKNLNELRNNLTEVQKERDELYKIKSLVVTKDDLIFDLKSEIQSKDDLLSDLNDKEAELQAEINSKVSLIADLQAEILSKDKIINSLTQVHTELQSEVVNKDNLIADLKTDSLSKDSLISSLSSEQSESHDYLCKFKSFYTKLQQLLSVLTGECVESEIIDDSMALFNTLCDRLTVVEVTAKEVVSQKDLAVASSSKLEQHIETLQNEIATLTRGKQDAENRLADLAQQTIELTQDLDTLNTEFKEVCTAKTELLKQLETSNESNRNLCEEIKEKENVITSLQNEQTELRLQISQIIEENRITKTQLENVQSLIRANKISFDDLLKEKDEEIIELQKLSNTLEETIQDRSDILESLNTAVSELVNKLDLPDLPNIDINGNNILETLKIATNQVILVKSSNSYSNTEFEELKQKLVQLQDQYNQAQENLSTADKEIENLNAEMDEIKNVNMKLHDDLHRSNGILQALEMDLKEKLNVIENLETKIKEWKENFVALEESMKKQIVELQEANFELQSQSTRTNETYSIHRDSSDQECYQPRSVRKSLTNVLVEPGKFSPQSLLTLCCAKIVNVLEPSEASLNTETNSSTTLNTEAINTSTQTNSCDCTNLREEIDIAREKNLDLKAKVEFLEYVNVKLLKEQEEVRKEMQLLIEPAYDLQKKISNHRTNLSTLTATTYAENKLLKSQVKVLQHHNNRFLNVCQRDLPIFKKSLQELSTILRSTSSFNRLEANIKRYSLPEVLDTNSSVSNYKDESTLDGDLLMLDTNVTIASVDNTLLGVDQTCLDGTQMDLDTEINADLIETIDPNILHTQLQILSMENQKQTKKIENLREEKSRLQEQLEKVANVKLCGLKVDAQSSPIKLNHTLTKEPANVFEINICPQCSTVNAAHEKMVQDIDLLTKELLEVKDQNSDLQKKCEDLNADIIENDKLVLKISTLEKENKSKLAQIDQLSMKLSSQAKEIQRLQEENDNLSTQVMDAIDESEMLRKEMDVLKEYKEELIKSTTATCLRCDNKTIVNKNTTKALSPANRSRSDSESSSRFNKLSTLQNELMAGREDCKTISEDVATIKNHLEHGNLTLSHDMDVSMGESNAFTIDEQIKPTNLNTSEIITRTEESPHYIYTQEKSDCFNYYIEKTGAENNLSEETKIIDIMRLLYDNLIAKQGDEVENLRNQLKDFSEARNQLQEKLNELDKIHDALKSKNDHFVSTNNVINQIKDNLNVLRQEISNSDGDENSVIVEKFKTVLLNVLDTEFQFTSVTIFETLIDKVVDKYQKDLVEIMTRYSELQGNMEQLTSELSSVTENIDQMKVQLADKEKEYNLLKAQKNMVHEISNAVTIDLVQQKRTVKETITKGYQALIEHNVLNPNDIDDTLSEDKCIIFFIEKLIEQFKQNDLNLQEKHKLLLEVTKSNTLLEEKDQEIESLKDKLDRLHDLCEEATNELLIKKETLETQKSLHEELNEIYVKKVDENSANIEIIESLTQEIAILKENVNTKGDTVQNLQEETKAKLAELTETVNILEHENKNLKSVNEMITRESEQNSTQLAEADDTIKRNKCELDKMTAEVLLLNESIKENMALIESLRIEAKTLLDQNVALKEQCKEANDLCSQLKTNMKTHEKTAEIQCKIMKRLKQEKEESGLLINEKTKQVEELTLKCEALQKDFKKLSDDIDKSKGEASELKAAKEALQQRVSELEGQLENANRPRLSLDQSRRRHSLLNQQPDHKKMEAYFSSATKPEDLFMDVDEHSNRSTPVRNRRSDSYQSRHDESERDDGSRPSSALAVRRRRQSTHDMHRRTHLTPDHLNTSGELNKKNNSDLSEVSLKERLEQCQQELDELKERYREVDEECEICAEYLRERDEQCQQLRDENKLLQQQISEKCSSCCKPEQRDACVNTDEDWTNLHSVVVDRMSFDREVEKNKLLKRSLDELRFKNSDLKSALAKALKQAERAARSKIDLQELEHTKSELESCKRQLEELKKRCQDLDEECEICGQYLSERDQQIAGLKATRDALEAKLEELQNRDAGSKLLSVRKKRQSVHDQNRNSSVEARDASTETNEDLLSYQVERDINSKLHNDEMQQLKMTMEKLSQRNAVLETQLRSAAPAPPVYVATGSAIVQNQHLTDVMKENQKLKNMNAKLIMICKKRSGKKSNRENDDPADMG